MTDGQEKKSLVGASSREIAEEIVRVLDEKNAKDIKLLRVDDKTSVTDYYVICTGNSSTQINALAGEVEYQLQEMGLTPAHTDGYNSGSWVALDYLFVIVHVLHREEREFYKLEKLWSDGEDIQITTTEK